MNIALIQFNPVVGDLSGNAARLIDLTRQAQLQNADLAIAPELCLCGYPPKDLLDRPTFVRELLDATDAVCAQNFSLPLVFGSITERDGRLYNSALAVQGGSRISVATKQLLPTYDVFDESRYFTPGTQTTITTIANRRCALTVCEDAWSADPALARRYSVDPLAPVSSRNCELLLNLSASPFTLNKYSARSQLFSLVAQRTGVPVAMANQVGGNDELIFDGHSGIWLPNGEAFHRAPSFSSALQVVDLTGSAVESKALTRPELAYQALVLGLRDYTRKCGFERAVLGLSGGIDSALVATLAADALGPNNVLGVAMPSRYSSDHSLLDARQLALNLGINFDVLPIEPMFERVLDCLQPQLDRLHTPYPGDVTWENVQARLRGLTIMALSNRTSALALTTGNKSEVAVGYCTLYGDMVGGLSVISDVPKTLVYEIAQWLNRETERIPNNSLIKPPSAELRPDQKDEDSLPPYSVLDAILEAHVEEGLSAPEIIAQGFNSETVNRVVRLVRGAEYKRRQAAPGLIITSKAFGPGRRMPLAQAFVEI
jgi:NAD+ synthase (glutamine-hydrolysing)